jgi:hypothetical protein
MKKVLTTLSLAATTIGFALAQAVQPVVQAGVAEQGAINGGALLAFLALLQTLVTRLVPFAIGLAVLAFFWYLIQFIWKGAEDAGKKAEAMKGMGYSILALFVMVSIWGLVGFLGSLFGIGQGGTTPIPGVPVPAN